MNLDNKSKLRAQQIKASLLQIRDKNESFERSEKRKCVKNSLHY